MSFAEHLPVLAILFGMSMDSFLAAYVANKRGFEGASFAILLGTILLFVMVILGIFWALPVQHGPIIHRVVS